MTNRSDNGNTGQGKMFRQTELKYAKDASAPKCSALTLNDSQLCTAFYLPAILPSCEDANSADNRNTGQGKMFHHAELKYAKDACGPVSCTLPMLHTRVCM